ncbi:MAG: 3-phosphoshikimate 1-carboxyvinyltransferase [Methanobacteriota archaeon]|nr:MAG: 3-phosphoshikimate 1-carboxyvinyltransferase [Euryarchaeota archaeon]
MEKNTSYNPSNLRIYEDLMSNRGDFFTFKSNNSFSEKIIWNLPSSKSHFIRWLFIAAQSEKKTIIRTPNSIGNDILSCANVLEKLGVRIIKNDYEWIIFGCKPGNYNNKPEELDCGNSATTVRFLSIFLARNGINAKVFGDESLSSRDFSELILLLEKGGISIKKENNNYLPFTLEGSLNLEILDVPVKKTSQLISALLITMPSSIEKLTLLLSNEIVSKPYFELTLELCIKTGANLEFNDGEIKIKPWNIQIIEEIIIPGEASLIFLPLLFCKLHKCRVEINNWPEIKDSLGFEMIREYISAIGLSWTNRKGSVIIDIDKSGEKHFFIDISKNIDSITPLSILMAISEGGVITGIDNAINKESNRIKSTIELCEKFGFELKFNDNLIISKSNLNAPKSLILAEGDHRLQMCAILLLTSTGGLVESFGWYENSDLNFIKRLYCQGVSIS